MVRTALTPISPQSVEDGALSANAGEFAMTAGDVANGNKFVSSGNNYVLLHNTSADTDYYYTITSAEDERGRSGTITQQDLAFGKMVLLGPFKRLGWAQPSGADSGSVQIDVENAAILIKVFSM